jgi:hypothetical protein
MRDGAFILSRIERGRVLIGVYRVRTSKRASCRNVAPLPWPSRRQFPNEQFHRRKRGSDKHCSAGPTACAIGRYPDRVSAAGAVGSGRTSRANSAIAAPSDSGTHAPDAYSAGRESSDAAEKEMSCAAR